MATTLNDIQSIISAEADESGSTISSNSSEYTRRTRLINNAERIWREHFRWSVLRTIATLTTDGTSSVTLPSDYSLGSQDLDAQNSVIKINNVYYKFVQPNEVALYEDTDNIVFITGNDVIGYQLNLQPTVASGVTFAFPYYSSYLATNASNVPQEFLVNPTDKTLISDPTFLSDYVLGRLLRSDDRVNVSSLYTQEALQSKLSKMVYKDVMAKGATVGNTNDNGLYEPIGGYID